MAGRWRKMEMLPNIYEKLWFLFRECLLFQYLKILNKCENVIKKVIKNVIKIFFFWKIVINYKLNH